MNADVAKPVETLGQFGAGLSVLVVDDDWATLSLARFMLESRGFTVESVDTCGAAAARCQVRGFDLMLTDKEMPDGSGLTLARMVFEGASDCEVVMMTGHADVESAVEAMQSHVADYIIKPFRLHDALSRISRVVQMQALKRRNRALVEQVRSISMDPESQGVRDPLTHLFNHAAFMQRLDAEMAQHDRDGRPLSVVLINVDGFKMANDRLGHAAGDRVLRAIADILGGDRGGGLGALATSRDIAARYGGDEFVLVFPGTRRAAALAKAELVRALVESHAFEAGEEPITVSAGVAEWPADGQGRSALLHAADTALFTAKALGRNRVVAYSPLLGSAGLERKVLDSVEIRQKLALDASLKARAFNFAYQPIVHSATQRILGYEGLCRPTQEMFKSPADLFTCAERNSRVLELGRMVRDLIVKPMPYLPEPLLLFVNLHPYELYDPQFLDGDSSLDPWASRVVLEVTEVGAVRDYGHLRESIKHLRRRGYKIGLDDLGSGYSGLNCLAQLDADYAKLDIGLLRSIRFGSRSARLVKHILEFAHEDNIQVIGEGIETEEERSVVTELGCQLLQGFYFARPGPAFVDVPRRSAASSHQGLWSFEGMGAQEAVG
jgi:diguanylate cyclase (GGDEF)-like protein